MKEQINWQSSNSSANFLYNYSPLGIVKAAGKFLIHFLQLLRHLHGCNVARKPTRGKHTLEEKGLEKGKVFWYCNTKISTKTCCCHQRYQSSADRRATMRSRLGPGSPSCSSRGTIEASATSLLTRLVRPRTLIFLSLLVIGGYIFTVSSHNSSRTIDDHHINQLDVKQNSNLAPKFF
jgi:hypothetical protein